MTAPTRTPRRTRLRRAAAIASVATVGALLLTACGDDMNGMEHGGGKSSPSASGDAGSTDTGSSDAGSAGFNDADVTFAQMMIPHHAQALDMAQLADGRASDAELKAIAEQIEKAQEPEIETMKGWLRSWDKPTAPESMPGMDHGDDDGMMSDADMRRLKGLKGTEFDKTFAEMMIQHHNGAITMAEDEQKNGRYGAAVKMAGAIVQGQTAEAEQLNDILDRL
ncbi:DUF305 domain-containing protein [Streptomyces sp. MB09-02B]|uniref:DUF305 domain-containing protein n=1 Tax=Streptomyces sp. MB09-02B TaxID=3028667 RepID=UPI0029B8FD84|nr:DUF305 domain-containing protein [Streptomyces sp. MB09-02B]MDX3640397.1 DUF305 domain-containing protein [Streptomyces sp. MB09-02B]